MPLEFRQAQAGDVPELGRICYEAFKDIADEHGFPTDFPTIEFAQQILGMLVQQEAVYSTTAIEGKTQRGSNFLNVWGAFAGSVEVSPHRCPISFWASPPIRVHRTRIRATAIG